MAQEGNNPTLEKLKKKRERDRKRAVYFKVGVSIHWKKPIHNILKKHKEKFPSLSWLRISMSYHRFTNLREHIQGDLTTKLIKGLDSEDFMTLECNCRDKKNCIYSGKCRSSIVVYQGNCLTTGKKHRKHTTTCQNKNSTTCTRRKKPIESESKIRFVR